MAGVPAGAAAPAPLAATNEEPATNVSTSERLRTANNSSGTVTPAITSGPITDCARITADGTYEVESFTNTSIPSYEGCIVIDTTGTVILEGTGFSGSTVEGGGGGSAIEVTSTSAIVELRDVTVENWTWGVDTATADTLLLTGLDARDVDEGVDAYGAETVAVYDSEIYNARDEGIDGRVTDYLDVQDVTVGGSGTGVQVDGSVLLPDDANVDDLDARDLRGPALDLGDDALSVDVDGLDVDNASSAVEVSDGPDGQVTNVTLEDTPVAVAASDNASGIRFEDVDLAGETTAFFSSKPGAEVTFTVSNASVGPATPSPSPRVPDGRTNGTGAVHLGPNVGATEFVVDYDPVVAEPFEDTVGGWAYESGSWSEPAGTVDAVAETVRFAPSTNETVGVFYAQSPVSSCAEFDAPGDYRIESISTGTAGDCLRITHDDVRLSGTAGGSTIDGSGDDGVAVDPRIRDAVVENLTLTGWTRGVNATGAGTVTVGAVDVSGTSDAGIEARGVDVLTVRDATVRDGVGVGLGVYRAKRVEVDGLRAANLAGTAGLFGTPGTGLYAGGDVRFHDLDVADVAVRNATRGVYVDGSAVGTVENVTTRDVREAVNVDGSRAESLEFDRIDTGTATASFTAADAVVGPATTAVSPPTPGARENATGHLNVTGGHPESYVEVDYGANVPEVYEGSLYAGPYASGVWQDSAARDEPNETVRFEVGDASDLYGVFARRPALTSCGVLDAPGVYEVDSFTGPVADGEPCLSIEADDVTVRGTAGATVTGNGTGLAIGADERFSDPYENVSVRDVALEQYDIGVFARYAGDVTFDGIRTANTSQVGVFVDESGRVTLRNVTVRRTEAFGVLIQVVQELTVDGLTVEDAVAGTIGRTTYPGTGLATSGVFDVDVRDVAVRNATRGVWLAEGRGADGTVANLSTTDVDEAVDATGSHADATIRDLATPEGRASIVAPRNLIATPSSAPGTPADRPVRLGAVDVTGTADDARADLRFRFDPAAVHASNVSIYEYDPGTGQWFLFGGTVDATNGTVTAPVLPDNGSTDVYGAFTTARDSTDPVAEAGPDRTVQPGEAVTFDGSNSTDDTGIAAYTWAFGDGATTAPRASPTVTHSYASEGTYRVNLTVADGAGNVDTDSLTVTVGPACPVVDGVRTTDTDDDGLCEDVDGNGKLEFFDVVALLFVDGSSLTGAEKATFDFDGDGRFGFLDVVTLLFEL
jgi:nitrous oxidase accessory protein NosD